MKKRNCFLCLPILLITFSLACTESPTESKIEPGLKLIVISSDPYSDLPELRNQVTEVETDETRTWQLPPEVDHPWMASVSAGPQGQLLLVEADGDIGVVSGEETKEYRHLGDQGLVAAWSNDGQQIAIVHEIPDDFEPPQTSLEILDADFKTLWTETIDLPVNDVPYRFFEACLSWSADDRLLAISRKGQRSRSYLIVDVQTRKAFPQDGYNTVFFIGSRVLAGRHFQDPSSSEIQVSHVDLQADNVDVGSPTTIVGPIGSWNWSLLASASSNSARLVIWKADVWSNFPYSDRGRCRILDEQGDVLAEMPEIFYIGSSFCLTRSGEAE